MIFRDNIRPEPTPERVYALCRLAKRYPRSRGELQTLMEPAGLNKGAGPFSAIFSFALNAEWVCEEGAQVRCSLPDEAVATVHGFRRYAARQAFRETDSAFFKLTSWYLAENERIFALRSLEDMDKSSQLPPELRNTSEFRGWRYWASFLGIGLLHDSFLIPNLAVRIGDALAGESSFWGRTLDMDQFVSWLTRQCPETERGTLRTEKVLALGVSNGLRVLHDLGVIEMENMSDADTIWHLYRMEAHRLTSQVTGVQIKGAGSHD